MSVESIIIGPSAGKLATLLRRMAFARGFVALGLVALSLFAGCEAREEIVTYSVPKEWVRDELSPPTKQPAETPAAIDGRILGAILPDRQTFWFFKLSGPDAAVAGQVEAVKKFLASVELASDDRAEPSWRLPEGWKQSNGGAMRFATISIPAEGRTLELAVSSLPLPAEKTTDAFLLENINRWRNQVQLAPVDASQLAAQSEFLEMAGRQATLINVAGKLSSGGMGGMPGSRAAPRRESPPAASTGARKSSNSGAASLRFDLPEGWREIDNDSFSMKAFVISGGDGAQAKVTISPLAGTGGDLSANVNRWRGQVGLPPLSADEVAAALKPIEVDGESGQYVAIIGEGGADARAVLGVILPRGDTTWFIKLLGPSETATREQARFEAFARSLRFGR